MNLGMAMLIVAVCSVFGAVGQIFFKLGSDNLHPSLMALATNHHLWLGLVLYGIATVGYVAVLRVGEVSMLYPIIALSYIWVGLLAVRYLDEKLIVANWLGFALIVGGVWLSQLR